MGTSKNNVTYYMNNAIEVYKKELEILDYVQEMDFTEFQGKAFTPKVLDKFSKVLKTKQGELFDYVWLDGYENYTYKTFGLEFQFRQRGQYSNQHKFSFSIFDLEKNQHGRKIFDIEILNKRIDEVRKSKLEKLARVEDEFKHLEFYINKFNALVDDIEFFQETMSYTFRKLVDSSNKITTYGLRKIK